MVISQRKKKQTKAQGCSSQLVSESSEVIDSSRKGTSTRLPSPMSSLGTVSPSEGSVSESLATDTSEFDLAAALVTSHRTSRAQANVQQFFTHFVDLRLGVWEVAGGNAGSSSRDYLQEAQCNIYEASTTTDRRSASRTKRSRQTENGNEDSGTK